MASWSALGLLLADGRLPSGGHSHSGTMEQAVDEGIVADVANLAAFLEGRLATTGRLDAHAAAETCRIRTAPDGEARLELLDAQIDARTVSPGARAASRRQGGQYLRAAAHALPGGSLAELSARWPAGPHFAIALGAAAAAAGLEPIEAARVAAYASVAAPASAAVRLLGLDPATVTAALAALMPACDDLASEAAVSTPPLPVASAPIHDWLSESHATRRERLFAS